MSTFEDISIRVVIYGYNILRPATSSHTLHSTRDAYNLVIIWPEARGIDADSFVHTLIFEHPFERMCGTPIAFVDSLILNLAEQVEGAETLVTWNAKHFGAEGFYLVGKVMVAKYNRNITLKLSLS